LFEGGGEAGRVGGDGGGGDEAAAEGEEAGVYRVELAEESIAEVGIFDGGVCVGDAELVELVEERGELGIYLGGAEFGGEEGL
jgi:hypothetical protein